MIQENFKFKKIIGDRLNQMMGISPDEIILDLLFQGLLRNKTVEDVIIIDDQFLLQEYLVIEQFFSR